MLPILPHSQRRRRLLAAAATAGATVVLAPSAAQAADVSLAFNTINYAGKPGELNRPRIAVQNAGTVFVTDVTAMTASAGCINLSPTQVQCSRAAGIDVAVLVLGDRNDSFFGVSQGALDSVRVLGGAGDDEYVGGVSASPQNVRFEGGAGIDTASYQRATSRVIVNKDGSGNDGRSGIDRDNVAPDVERLIGSQFGDALIGSDIPGDFTGETLAGLAGNDLLNGRRGLVTYDMGEAPDGADTVEATGALAFVDYRRRSRPVRVSVASGTRDDGEVGEGDDIREAASVFGGAAGDTLLGADSSAAVFLDGGPGNDIMGGTRHNDNLLGGAGIDIMNAGAGVDSVTARDGEPDTIDCGSDSDFLNRDSAETSVVSCETTNVGVLRLAPDRLATQVGETRALRLSWSHPRSWRRLRSVELRLRDEARVVVGRIVIRPRTEQVEAIGAQLRLRPGMVRVTRPSAKRVAAVIALRPTAALAGRRLSAEVQAVDTAGRRQLELDAGTVHVRRA